MHHCGLVFNVGCLIAIFPSALSFVALCFFQAFAQMMVVVPMNGMVRGSVRCTRDPLDRADEQA